MEKTIKISPEELANALRVAASVIERGVRDDDEWVAVNVDYDIHITVEHGNYHAVLYPVLNGSTVVDYSLELFSGLSLNLLPTSSF